MGSVQNERLSTAKSAGRNRFLSAEIRPRRDSLRQSERSSAKRVRGCRSTRQSPRKNHFFWNRDGTVRLKHLQRILEDRRGDFCLEKGQYEGHRLYYEYCGFWFD